MVEQIEWLFFFFFYNLEADRYSPKPKPNSDEKVHGFNCLLTATRELQHSQVLGKAYSDQALWLRNNNADLPIKNKSSYGHLILTSNWRLHIEEKNTVQTLILFLFPFVAWEWNGSQYCLFCITSVFLKQAEPLLQPKWLWLWIKYPIKS